MLAMATPAAAKSKVVLFPVAPLPGEVEMLPAQQMTRVIADELAQEQEIEGVVGREAAAQNATPTKATAGRDHDYRAALAQLAEGEKLAERMRFPQAMRALSRAIDGLTRNLDQIEHYERLLDAYVLLAACHFRRGKEASGAELLDLVARLRPDHTLDRSKYPPVFTSVYEQALSRVLARPRGALRVTSSPAGAEVALNGRTLGNTPLTIGEVVAGEAHVVVRSAGRAQAKIVTVREGATEEVHVALGGAEGGSLADALAGNRFDRDTRKLARGLAKDVGGDFVVLLAMGKSEGLYMIAGFLGNVRTGKWTRLTPATPDYDLLSDTIEAHRLASDVGRRVRGDFGASLSDDALVFLDGKPSRAGASALLPARETHVAVATPSAARERGPIAPAPPPQPEPIHLVPPPVEPPPEALAGERRPIGAASSERPPARPSERLPEPRRGRTRERDKGGRAPIVADQDPAAPVELDLELVTPRDPPRAVAAALVAEEKSGPWGRPDIEAKADQGSIMDRPWFWPVMAGVTAAAAGGAVYFLFLRDRDPNSVKVYAVW